MFGRNNYHGKHRKEDKELAKDEAFTDTLAKINEDKREGKLDDTGIFKKVVVEDFVELNKTEAIPIKATHTLFDGTEIAFDYKFMVIDRIAYGYPESWGFLCDENGYKFHYSLTITSTKYRDGYLDSYNGREPTDWIACMPSPGYDKILVSKEELLRCLGELGYYGN